MSTTKWLIEVVGTVQNWMFGGAQQSLSSGQSK